MKLPQYIQDKMSNWTKEQWALYKEAIGYGWDKVAAAQYADSSIKDKEQLIDDDDDDELFDEYLSDLSSSNF
jgi:hypothetical protein